MSKDMLNIMDDDIFFIQLHDCFTAGYTLPQFCIDNNIKQPLFIAIDERRSYFMWEIYTQFKYDRRINPKFTLFNGKTGSINFSAGSLLPPTILENIADINLVEHDKIFVLGVTRINDISNAIYIDRLTDYFISKTYVEVSLLHFLQRHPRVKLIVTNFPKQPKIDDENFLKKFYNIIELRYKLDHDKSGNVPTHFDKLGYNNEDVAALIKTVPIFNTNLGGAAYMQEDSNPIVNIKNNQRMTAYQPENFINKIYFVGSCHQYGINAPFDKTIPSYLQKMLNEHNLPYRVENMSQRYFYRYQEIFYNLCKLAPKPNDIIFVYVNDIEPCKLPFFDVSNAFADYDYKKIWVIKEHVNEIGYKILAEKYFEFLTKNSFFKNVKFEYPPPPPAASSLRYPARKFFSGD